MGEEGQLMKFKQPFPWLGGMAGELLMLLHLEAELFKSLKIESIQPSKRFVNQNVDAEIAIVGHLVFNV